MDGASVTTTGGAPNLTATHYGRKPTRVRSRAARAQLSGKRKPWRSARGQAKIKKTMGEFKAGSLHSGSKKGPKVTSRAQAVAISLNQARRAG
jgi:hypothetical protein